jgi:hypothetical protein
MAADPDLEFIMMANCANMSKIRTEQSASGSDGGLLETIGSELTSDFAACSLELHEIFEDSPTMCQDHSQFARTVNTVSEPLYAAPPVTLDKEP